MPFRGKTVLPLTLCILYVACVTCKLPVLLVSVWRWAADGTIPYVDVLACLGPELRAALPRRERRRLERPRFPKVASLHRNVGLLASCLLATQRVPLPAIQPIHVVWRALAACGLPYDLYPVAMRMLRVLSVAEGHQVYCRFNHFIGRGAFPEVDVFVAVVFLWKLLYGPVPFVSNRFRMAHHKRLCEAGLPSLDSLVELWAERIEHFDADFVNNQCRLLHWRDLPKFVERQALVVQGSVAINNALGKELARELFRDMPDLRAVLNTATMPYDPSLKPAGRRVQGVDLHASLAVSKSLPKDLAARCIAYGKKASVQDLHEPFRLLLQWMGRHTGVGAPFLLKRYLMHFE